MSFKIDLYYSGPMRKRYKITITEEAFGTIRAEAADLQEVAYALEHYFQAPLFHEGCTPATFNYTKHVEHNKECKCCPLCRIN